MNFILSSTFMIPTNLLRNIQDLKSAIWLIAEYSVEVCPFLVLPFRPSQSCRTRRQEQRGINRDSDSVFNMRQVPGYLTFWQQRNPEKMFSECTFYYNSCNITHTNYQRIRAQAAYLLLLFIHLLFCLVLSHL